MRNLIIALSSLLIVSCGSSSKPSADEVMEITRRVADWQIETFADQGKYRALPPAELCKPWHHRERYDDLEWIPATFYSGLSTFAKYADDKEYTDWLMKMGDQHGWKLYKREFHADDHAVGHFYMDMYSRFKDPKMLNPTLEQFTGIMTGAGKDRFHWHWCDALYMAPPVWARLAKVTGDQRFLEYMDYQYHMTYDALWDKEEHLFFRDKKYLTMQEDNGEKIFWARGNGWVYGGLAAMIPDIPTDWNGRDFYITLFKEMSAKLKEIQREDGTWSTGLLGGTTAYPELETSGSAFFVYGLAWGLNNGILDKSEYEETMLKGWEALCNVVTEDGMLGYVQGVGAAPGTSYPDYTELYGSGAFISAGTEVYKYVK